MRLLLLLASTTLLCRAEDASRPHTHRGTFKRYTNGPPKANGMALSAARRRRLKDAKDCSVESLPVSPTSPKGTMRCSSVQMVEFPASTVWDVLLDYPNYPRFIGGITAVKPYSNRPTLTGGKVTCAKYQVSLGLYKLKYFVEHKYEPLQKSMVWSLDYSRLSDIFDSVGYWYVEPDGSDRSIVYYTQCTLLPAWIPLPLKKTFTTVAMNSATAKLAPACAEAQEKSRAKGGLRLPRLPSADSVLKRFSK